MEKKVTRKTKAANVSEDTTIPTSCCFDCPQCDKNCQQCKTCTSCGNCAMQAIQSSKRNWTPLLMVALLIASFFLGSFYTKMQYLEKGGANAGTNNNQQVQGAAAPTPAKIDMKAGKYPIMGNKDAKVLIVEFADFQCPFCERFYKEAGTQIINDYVKTGKVALTFRDYPFLGQESTDAANAARCANEQGKFWEYHDYLYNNQGQENSGAFSKDNLKKFAANLGLNTDQFNSCLDTSKYANDVAEDLKVGQQAGVQGTPAAFINGQIVVGAQPYASFKTLIDQELAKK